MSLNTDDWVTAKDVGATIKRFLEDEDSMAAAFDLDATGCYGDAWAGASRRIGLAGLLADELHGGSNLGPQSMVEVAKVLGAHLFCGPFLSTAVVSTSLLKAASAAPHIDSLAGSLAMGEKTCTLAWSETEMSWRIPDLPKTALDVEGPDGLTLTGTKTLVPDACTSDAFLVWARLPSGRSGLFLCNRSDRVTTSALRSVDTTLRLGVVHFDRAHAQPLEYPTGTRRAIEWALDVARLALSASQAGAARTAMTQALGHVSVRRQFDRPVGSFQAVKHECANMAVAVSALDCLVSMGARLGAGFGEQLARVAPLISAHASESYRVVAESALHLHGGMGFTWEHPAHLFFKNALATWSLLGTPDDDRALFAERSRLTTGFAPLEATILPPLKNRGTS